MAVLARALVRRDYRLTYVADVVARAASRPYRLAGLWAAMAGSLLLYAAMAAVAVALGSVGVARHPRLLGGYPRAGSLVPAWLLGVSLLAADPFRRLAQPAIDGVGLTPILEHPAMLVHPPLLYAGALATLPLAALALAARWTRAVDGSTVTLRPGLRVYETAGAVLPETARRAGWLLDTQVALRRFDPSGAVVLDVHVRPFIRWVWVAALVMLAAFLGAFVTSARGRGRLSACRPE